MKNIIKLLLTILLLSSCVKYTQPKLLSLSGTYVVDKITYLKIDNSDTTGFQVYYPGDMYVNPNIYNPFDTLKVGETKFSMDYQLFFYNPVETATGSTYWKDKCDYDVQNETNNFLGYLILYPDNYNKKIVFSIIDDGLESLVIRQTGHWAFGSSGPDESITIYLTRTGP
jgi:hypothetical protein